MHFQTSVKRNRRSVRFIVPIIALALAVILIVFGARVPGPLRSTALTIAQPFWYALSQAKMAALTGVESFLPDTELRARNSALKNELEQARRELFTARLAAGGSAGVRSGTASTTEMREVYASVLTSTRYAPFDVFVIDQGSQNGIVTGALVTTLEGNAVGYVNHVAEGTAIVHLFSSPSAITNVQLTGSSTVRAEAYGKGGGTLELRVPRDHHVSLNDTLTLPGSVPFLVATVINIDSEPEAAHKLILARLLAQNSTLHQVVVLPELTWRIDEETLRLLDEQLTASSTPSE